MQARLPDGSVIISGFIAKDAEYKQVGGNNSSLTKFSVKVGERQPKVQGERGEAIWVSCQCWHSVARATKALKKFDVVLCVGKVEKKPYTSKDGEEKVDVHLVCEAVFVQPTAEAAPPQELGGDLSDFEEVLNDEGTPF